REIPSSSCAGGGRSPSSEPLLLALMLLPITMTEPEELRGLRFENLRNASALSFFDATDMVVCLLLFVTEGASAFGGGGERTSEGVELLLVILVVVALLVSKEKRGDGDGELARRMAYWMLGERGEEGAVLSAAKSDGWDGFAVRW
ncbi:hypothetical protein BDZ97DRAFT_1805879, partial [Flammula alnicola]